MDERMANRMAYIGAGMGVALFALFGLMPGAYLGGILGLNTANSIAGIGGGMPSLLHRVLTALGMLTGVFMTGLMFVLAGAAAGWLAGAGAEWVKGRMNHKDVARQAAKG